MSSNEEASHDSEGSPLSVGTEEHPTAWKLYRPIDFNGISAEMDISAQNLKRNSEIVNSATKRSSPGPLPGDKVCVTLHNQELWKRFSDIGNEMIVTRSGR